MGALPPAPHWLPHDDFLLKNAAEAGASLESLAKGAVQFSRRFTVEELKDRWSSLLYDPVLSEQASAGMIEFEHSFALSKLNSFDIDKDNRSVSGKRKTQSVKSYYYSTRKRIRNEVFHCMDLDFLTGPVNNCDPPLPDSLFGDSLADEFGDQGSGLDFIHSVFPDLEIGHVNSTGGDGDGDGGVDVTYFAGEHNDHLLDSIDMPDPENVSGTGFEVELLNSPVSDCGKLIHAFGYSPSSQMEDWTTFEGISTPILPEFQTTDKEPDMRHDFMLPVDGDYGIIPSEYKMEDQIACDNMGISTPSTDDLLAKIDSILNSTSDDDIFPIDNEIIGESYLDTYGSLLLDSPNGGEIANESISPALIAPDKQLNIDPHPKESAHKSQDHSGDRHVYNGSEGQMLSSALSVNPACPELRNGVICCTLNTEDPDIPSNDDVFLPVRMPSTPLPSAVLSKYDETYNPGPSCLKNSLNIQTNNNGWSVLKKREKSNLEQSCLSSQKVELLRHSAVGLNHAVGDCGPSYVVPNSDTGNVIMRNTSSNDGPKVVTSPRTSTVCGLSVATKERITKDDHTKSLTSNRNHQLRASPNPMCWQKKIVTIKQEPGSIDTPQKQDLGPQGQSANTSMMDGEDLPDDSDEDIPNFSDVEALILDMDLCPDDKDISFDKEVAKYQHEQTKRTIMRLEQATDAHMQRLIASQGAFAVLYSRHSNHFIKKTEVLVGRGTADTEVDIDLSRECRGNKVSRRQAIIKINVDGVFLLQNVSKHLIHVNGKEITPCQSVRLASSSLIEVRGMAFVFEMNRSRVKQLVDNMRQGTLIKENNEG